MNLSRSVRRTVTWIFVVGLLVGSARTAAAQPMHGASSERAFPADYAAQLLSPAWRAAFPYRSAFGSLCSLGPLACALIDRPFAFNAHLELFIRPRAPDGSTALLLPFALSVPLFGRAEVGFSSCYAGFWASKENADRINADPSIQRPGGLCPLTLAGKLLLFPWFRDPHQNGALAVEYQLEYRAGPFDGVNQLGLPGPLSKISLAYRHPWKRLELSGAASVLVDHVSRAGTLQLGAHVGYRLPVGEHFWIFGQVMAQVPSWGPVITDFASGQTLNLAPPVAGTLAAGLQQRADFGFGVGLTMMLTKSEVDTRFDLLLRLLSFEIGPHIKPVWRAREKRDEPPKVEVAVNKPAVAPVCPEGMQPATPASGEPVPSGAAPACVPMPPPERPPPSPLWGHPCYLAPLDGSEHLRMGFIDSTGQYCDWDGLRLPLGAVISPPRKPLPHEESKSPPPQPSGAQSAVPKFPPAAGPPVSPERPGATRRATGLRPKPSPVASATPPPPAPADTSTSPPRSRRDHVERITEEPQSVPGSPFLSGFVDRGKAAYKHSKDIYRTVKKHGIAVVLPSDQEAAEWLRSVKEECLEEFNDCLKEKAQWAADELNAYRKKLGEDPYVRGELAFDVFTNTAAGVMIPGGGAVAGTAMKEGETLAAKGAAKAALKKAGKELGEEAAEHVDEAAARKILRETEWRAAKEAVPKAVNLPGWKKVEIDMPHIMDRHVPDAPLAAGRTLFPEHMSETAIERAVRQGYRYGETVGGQGERVLVRGTVEGLTIEMWVNKATKTIETAYPVF